MGLHPAILLFVFDKPYSDDYLGGVSAVTSFAGAFN